MELGTVFIVAIIFGCMFGGRYLRHKMRMFELKLETEKSFSGDLRKELEEIRDRLATLEKIVTTKKYQLSEEIDNL